MKKLRSVLLLLLVSIGFAITLTLLARAVGFTSPLFAIVASFNILGLLAFARPWIVLKLPRPLQTVHAWEVKGDLYRALGVSIFGTLLRDSPLRYLNSAVYLNRWHGDGAAVCNEMEIAEAAHLWDIALTIPYVVYVVIQRRWSALFWITIFNLVVNVYPVLHLRWVRGRLTRVRDARNRKLRCTTG
jgi:hypothetical protein